MKQRHWLKPDHITFLLMLPLIVGGLINSLIINHIVIGSTFIIILALWTFAFLYDCLEHKLENLQHQGD